MSDANNPGAATAGGLLRAARESRGLSVAALSALVKVAQRKVESLEADRLDELPDATFARALAQTLCRALKIDAAPVLAVLPDKGGYRLEHMGTGINAPFRDRPNRLLVRDGGGANSPWVWASAAVVIAAVAVVLVPASWWTTLSAGRAAPDTVGREASAPEVAAVLAPASQPLPDGSSASAVASPPTIAETASAPVALHLPPTEPAAGRATAASASATSGAADLQLHARAESWVEVQDAQGKILLSRTLASGEQVALEGAPPLKLKVGNAQSTDVAYRGVQVDLAPSTRDNVARLEIKP